MRSLCIVGQRRESLIDLVHRGGETPRGHLGRWKHFPNVGRTKVYNIVSEREEPKALFCKKSKSFHQGSVISCWLGCVLIANKPTLQCWNGIEPSSPRQSRFCCFFLASECNYNVHVCSDELSRRRNGPLVLRLKSCAYSYVEADDFYFNETKYEQKFLRISAWCPKL